MREIEESKRMFEDMESTLGLPQQTNPTLKRKT